MGIRPICLHSDTKYGTTWHRIWCFRNRDTQLTYHGYVADVRERMTTVYKEVGESVYYFNIRKYPRSQRQGGYSGPYLVIQVLSPVTVALNAERSEGQAIHCACGQKSRGISLRHRSRFCNSAISTNSFFLSFFKSFTLYMIYHTCLCLCSRYRYTFVLFTFLARRM